VKKLAAVTFLLVPFVASADSGAVRPIAPQRILDAVSVSAGSGVSGYVRAAHMFGVVAVSAIAVVVVVWGAILVFGESVTGKKGGKEKIWNAVWGLLLAAGSYVILGTISTSLLSADFGLSDIGKLGADATTATDISAPSVGNINRPTYYSWGTSGAGTDGYTYNGTAQTGSWSSVNTMSELTAWQQQYMRNMDPASLAAAGATLNADGTYTLTSRVTGYWDGDPDTDAGMSAFGALRSYSGAGTYGTAAVDPSVVPYGSVVAVTRNGSTQYYVAEDIGSAVVNRQASGGSVPVIDIATTSSWDGRYQDVRVYPYTGTTPYTSLSQEQRNSYLQSTGISR
jgi:3D (Asp-Asp-Asp) domain-containing protein